MPQTILLHNPLQGGFFLCYFHSLMQHPYVSNALRAAISLLLLCLPAIVYGRADTTYHGYFGLLHAHTMICDGSGTPQEAYAMAKAAGLNFFALTPHNHIEAESGAKERKDGVLIAKRRELYDGNQNLTATRKWKENNTMHTEQVSITPLLKAAREATDSRFIALYGQECSTISSGNHVNVFGLTQVYSGENGNFGQLLAALAGTKGNPPVIQLNHPGVEQDLFYSGSNTSERHRMYNDYGIDAGDLGPDFRQWVTAMQPYTHLIEVLSGPAMAQERTEHYHYADNENDYFFYLRQGLHVGPSAGQDNHYKTWGIATDARTGIVARELSSAGIYDAFRRHRTFSTEDKNLYTALYVNDSLMGASVTVRPGAALDMKVHIRDSDEPGATYEIGVYSSAIHPELSTQATDVKASAGLIAKSTVRGNGLHAVSGIRSREAYAFYYIRVTQQDGDRSWTAPVWVSQSGAPVAHEPQVPQHNGAIHAAKYYWTATSSSKVYHIPGCSGIQQIKSTNLRSSNTPPAGRRQHDCKVSGR
jgi:hypothetical protein